MRQVVTVDGLAGTGKTTLAKLLAQKLGFIHLSSGLLYRAVAFLAMKNGVSAEDEAALEILVKSHALLLDVDANGGSRILIDKSDRTAELHTPEISDMTSRASVHPRVRRALSAHQREAFPGKGLVAEGRDMGTVIFPDAVAKFFIEASEEVRVTRRLAQFSERGVQAQNGQELKKNVEIEIKERDRRDQGRAEAPARPAEDALIVDNSRQTLTMVLDTMYSLALSKGVRPER